MPDNRQQKHLTPADRQRAVVPRSTLASRGLELALNVLQENKRTWYDEGDAATETVRWWYYRANEQDDADAQYMLGVMYEEGDGVPQDAAEAVRWYRRAAEQGHADAQSSLGDMYDEGRRVPQDDVEAAYWYRQAAEQGDAYAQYALGFMYAEGQGVSQDHAEAVRWYRRAAEQDHAHAQLMLGDLYDDGRGVPQDYIQAHKWFNLTASRGSSSVREVAVQFREEVASKMTPAQIAEAQRLAREWKPKMRVQEEK